jgi:hypothetical protein
VILGGPHIFVFSEEAKSHARAVAAGLESISPKGQKESGPVGSFVVFEHPSMSEREILEANAQVMLRRYSMGRIIKRMLHTTRRRISTDFAMTSFFAQLGLRKTYR